MINLVVQIYVNAIHVRMHIENPMNGLSVYVYLLWTLFDLTLLRHPHIFYSVRLYIRICIYTLNLKRKEMMTEE